MTQGLWTRCDTGGGSHSAHWRLLLGRADTILYAVGQGRGIHVQSTQWLGLGCLAAKVRPSRSKAEQDQPCCLTFSSSASTMGTSHTAVSPKGIKILGCDPAHVSRPGPPSPVNVPRWPTLVLKLSWSAAMAGCHSCASSFMCTKQPIVCQHKSAPSVDKAMCQVLSHMSADLHPESPSKSAAAKSTEAQASLWRTLILKVLPVSCICSCKLVIVQLPRAPHAATHLRLLRHWDACCIGVLH